ncbi:DUF6457 domain-containing protein [Nocardioides sp.]|uniref:DUF6457 domain-containing protein n=1 Tax=Nocardioides sp. TaxID=35761 RepID=UPI0027176216|nr:DUF6457 domain-containing protein [Nocardioides sp.]MDO9456102.1 DUF6457 domain-containing protein [Nocardioides sp.]
MNLHDWIDELCDVLDLETEVDEGLLTDLAELTHDKVDAHAGPVTAYLLGYAAGGRGAGPVTIERLAGKAQELAESWDRPADAPDPDDIDDPIPEDTTIDHTVDLEGDDDDDDDSDSDSDETQDAGDTK